MMWEAFGCDKTLFDDVFLPVKPGQLKEKLWKDDEWVKWSGRDASETFYLNASEMKSFIEHVAKEAESEMGSTSANTRFNRRWSSVFLDKPLPSKEGETGMPDLVLLDNDISEEEASWKNIDSVMDVRHTFESPKEAYLRMTRYAENIFKEQPGRRFVITISIRQETVEVFVFDRSGSLFCGALGSTFLHHPESILRIILGTLFIDRQELGFDTTLYHKNGDNEHTYMTVQGVEYRVQNIYYERNMHGRGTVCYHGVCVSYGSVVVIKDQWTQASTRNRELRILELLNKGGESSVCTPDGVRVIPKVIAKEIVTIRRPCHKGEEHILADVEDTTAIYRDDESEHTSLAHWRIVMAPFGQKIQLFTTLRGLPTIFSDIVHAIRIAHSKGVLHRDISHRNILWYYHGGFPRGLLIDYDCAVFTHEIFSSVGCGTPTYFPLNRLVKEDDHPHDYCEDLESLFYVICFIMTIYDGPRYTPRIFPPGTSFQDLDMDRMQGCKEWKHWTHKLYAIKLRAVLMAENRLFDNIAPYFEVFKDCLRRLHELLFNPDACVWTRERLLAAEKKVELERLYALCEEGEVDRIEERFNKELNIWNRPPDIVFNSFLKAFKEAFKRIDIQEEMELINKNRRYQESFRATESVHINVPSVNKNIDEHQGANEMDTKPLPLQVILPVAPAPQIAPFASDPRKRKAGENAEAESTKCKRKKGVLVPLQPSAVVNVPVNETGDVVEKQHLLPEVDGPMVVDI